MKLNSFNKFNKYLITAIAALLLLSSVISGIPVFAENGTDTITVGYYLLDDFQMMDEVTGEKSGYGYEYLQKVAQYGGFKYEYVYGTYSELAEKVRNGQIDIMLYCYTDNMDFSVYSLGDYSVLLKWYYFYKRIDDVTTTDYSIFDLDGKTIGVPDDDNEIGLLNSYLSSFDYLFEEDPYDPEYIPPERPDIRTKKYSDVEVMASDLSSGAIDLLVGTVDFEKGRPSFVRMSKFNALNYFIVTKINDYYQADDEDLAFRICDAIDRFISTEPTYEKAENSELFDKYYSVAGGKLGLSETELNYIENHGNVKIGYLDNFLPYCSRDENGNPSGIVCDVFSEILKIQGLSDKLSCTYVSFASGEDMLKALTDGKIDVLFPYIGNQWDAEERCISTTSCVMNSAVSIAVRGSYDKSRIRDLAVNRSNPMTELESKKYFPDAVLHDYGSTEECLTALSEGKTDGVVMSSLRAGQLLKQKRFSSLSAVSLQNTSEVTFAVSRGNPVLLDILNRGIYGMDADFAANNSYGYLDGMYSYGFRDYVLDNLVTILGIFSVVLLFIVVIIAVETKKRSDNNRKYQAELEEARRQADDANKAKTDFLFNMSHDIRTPMNAIMGFTGMAIKHIDDREKAFDCLEKTQKAGNMLLSLINSVLEVSRIESGHAVLDEQPGDVMLSFAAIENTMQEMAETKDISLSFDFENITDRFVYADFSRCMRVLVNIISNAIKYTPDNGVVRVKCEQLGEAKDGYGTYRYSVSDNGIGMSEEFQKHIFEQFSREKTTTVSGIQGSGLGMSVVKSFVELMNGTVTVKSRPGEGTLITITLPFRIQEGRTYTDPVTGDVVTSFAEPENTEMISFAGKKVLLVEDNELNREIAAETLEEERLIVDSADDGTMAVDILKEKGPDYYDFILMDIQMPVMNGYDATKAIREMYPDKHIPIIALSANAFAEDKMKSLEAEMDDHVAKPINIKDLFNVLARYL